EKGLKECEAMQPTPYLMFDGCCAEAFHFYAELLNGEITMMQSHADTPAADRVPADWQDKIIHARMTLADGELMASDVPPDYQEKFGGFSLSIDADSADEARRIFDGLSEGGSIQMPLE